MAKCAQGVVNRYQFYLFAQAKRKSKMRWNEHWVSERTWRSCWRGKAKAIFLPHKGGKKMPSTLPHTAHSLAKWNKTKRPSVPDNTSWPEELANQRSAFPRSSLILRTQLLHRPRPTSNQPVLRPCWAWWIAKAPAASSCYWRYCGSIDVCELQLS